MDFILGKKKKLMGNKLFISFHSHNKEYNLDKKNAFLYVLLINNIVIGISY